MLSSGEVDDHRRILAAWDLVGVTVLVVSETSLALALTFCIFLSSAHPGESTSLY